MKHKSLERYYYGDWDKGMPEGKGVIYEPSSIWFSGNFHNGLPEGPAQINFVQEGCNYEGEMKGGKAHGNGTVTSLKHKYTFIGEWENSRPQKGTLTLVSDPNIANIEIQDLGKGEVVINYKDQRRYEGAFARIQATSTPAN